MRNNDKISVLRAFRTKNGIFMQGCFSIIKTKEICVPERRETGSGSPEGPHDGHDDAMQAPSGHRKGHCGDIRGKTTRSSACLRGQ